MILALLTLAAPLAQTKDPIAVNTERPTLLVIYKERAVLVNGISGASPGDVHGSSITYDRVGIINWKVLDGGAKGIPCHVYTGDGKWIYQTDIPHTARRDYHEASYKVLFYVALDGTPVHSESHFSDIGEKDDAKKIDILTDYSSDHLDITKTVNGVTTKNEIYPLDGMDKYAGMFQPMMSQGLVLHSEMDCTVIHPYTGLPYEFKLSVAKRFTGQYFFMPQEGYVIDVDGSEGKNTTYVTRQGQLIQTFMPHGFQATLEEGPGLDERQGWGHFDIMDWNKSTADANPARPIYHTMAIPVMFDHPKILFPVPCAITD